MEKYVHGLGLKELATLYVFTGKQMSSLGGGGANQSTWE